MSSIIHICIVTYSGNAHTLPYAHAAARRAWPAAPITVLDDARYPVPPSTRRRLTADPCTIYRMTRWGRGGNLCGRACLHGLLSEYRRAMQGGTAYVVKLDADALVLHPDAIDALMIRGVDYATHGTIDGPYGGAANLMSRDAVRTLARVVRRMPLPPAAREDMTMGALATAAGLRVVLHGVEPDDRGRYYHVGVDVTRHSAARYVDHIAAAVAIANVGTSRQMGGATIDEARMAAALLVARYPGTTLHHHHV